MTVKELLECVKDVKIEPKYQHIKTCPADPVTPGPTERTFLGEVRQTSNVIGKDHPEALRALCFNADAHRTPNTKKRGGEDR